MAKTKTKTNMKWWQVRYQYDLPTRKGEGLVSLQAENSEEAKKLALKRKHSKQRPIEITGVKEVQILSADEVKKVNATITRGNENDENEISSSAVSSSN